MGAGGGGRKTVGGWGLSPEASAKGDTSNSLVIAKERETLKTLAYDCGNPVLICLRAFARSAFLFTGSPRSFHSLAMTKGTKWIIPHSLTTPSASRHPSNGGELGTFPPRNKVPLCGGVARSAGVVHHPKPWRRVTRVTPLSLRRSTINVENVGVRLWQSSAICLRASARSAFLFTGSPRSARDDKGE